MTDKVPENKYMQLNAMISKACIERGLPLPMATEFNMNRGGLRMYMHYDPNVARHVAATGKVILREIMDALEQKDTELAKKMLAKEIAVL